MAFSTHYFTNIPSKAIRSLVWAWVLNVLLMASVWAQAVGEIGQLQIERMDDELALSAQMQFELPGAVEEVLVKGIPVTFTAEAEIYRERWYWFDKRLTFAKRSYRLSFQPLSRRWRVTVAAPSGESGAGLSLNQSFDTMSEALGHIKRISKWRVADASTLDPSQRYRLEFRYRLDVTQLALPMQIGTLGQSDWNVTLSASKLFSAELVR